MGSATVHEKMKHTPLYPVQVALRPKFGSFGGWELPIYYTSILKEHLAVRCRVGLFDVSHLGHLEVSGPGALGELQPLFTQDLSRMAAAQACYSLMLNLKGGILDEMILYRLSEDRFRLVVNASNAEKVLHGLASHLTASVKVEDLRESVGTLAVQGPQAVELVKRSSRMDAETIPRYTLRPAQVADRPVLLARTGYTGEDGFELFVGACDLPPVWEKLLEEGRPFEIQPIGLGARDTLRLEAGLPLYGNDLDETTTPLEAGLEWTIAWEKGDFIGRETLERQKEDGVPRRLVGFELKGPGVPRIGYPILHEGKSVGQVTSGTAVPSEYGAGWEEPLRGIGMGYVPPSLTQAGTPLSIEIHGKPVMALVVKLPFYKRR